MQESLQEQRAETQPSKTMIKTYSHDYSLPQMADTVLCYAQEQLRLGNLDAAKASIAKARDLIIKYCSQDNMFEDNECYDGWCKLSDAKNMMNNI